MTVQEPPWLKRIRPCPFFSQGRCLFADSCNFLHDVKVRNPVAQSQPSSVHAEQPSVPLDFVLDPPFVVVNSATPRSDDLVPPESPASSIPDSSRYSGLLSVLSDVIGPPSNPPAQAEQGIFTRPEPSSVLGHDPVARMESFFPEVAGELVVQFMPIPDDDENLAVEDTTCYFVEDSGTRVVASDAEAEDDRGMDDHEDEDPTMVESNRQSILSSFTGASLLASPRDSFFMPSSVTISTEESAVDLLSPVQLSAKLQPFPIPSLGSKAKRGGSIDSGYADGDSWVSPLPFPFSPPRSFRSSMSFLSHSRRASHASPASRDRRTLHDLGALRATSFNPIDIIKEVEPDENGKDEEEDVTFAILGAYDTSPSEQHGEKEACNPFQLNVAVVAEENADKDDVQSDVPTVMCHLRQSPERLHPTTEHDLDPCNLSSFISDDNLSFKTALSTQPSYDDLSDASKISLLGNDSLLPSVSGRSTPNTSVLSYYSDANELLEAPVVNADVRGSPCLVALTSIASQSDFIAIADAKGSEECSRSEEAPVNSDKSFPVTVAGGLYGLVSEKAVVPRDSLSDVSRFDRHSPTSGSYEVDTSHSLPSAKGILGRVPLGAGDIQEHVSGNVVSPPERVFGAFHFDKHPPESNPSASSSVRDVFCSAPDTDHSQESASENTVVLREYLPGILHYDQSSLECLQSSPSVIGVSSDALPGPCGIQDPIPETVVAQACLSPTFHVDKRCPRASLSVQSICPSLPVEVVHEYAPPEADCGGSRLRKQSLIDLHGHSIGCATPKEGLCLVTENSLQPDGTTEPIDLECDDFVRPLIFPLPPSFLPNESVGCSTLSAEDMFDIPQAAGKSPERGAPNLGKVQQTHSSPNLTEKARLSQLPLVGSTDTGNEFTLRRSRAASDLTVKGRSPTASVFGNNHTSRASPPPLEQPGRSDSVQSLYDQYLEDGASDDSSEFAVPARKSMAPSGVSSPAEEPSEGASLQSADHISHVFHGARSPFSDSKENVPDTESPRSETVLRPFWTGRSSFLRSSLTDPIPKANPVDAGQFSPLTPPCTRLQVREFGSTMVPLGFRRHKPQPATTPSLRSAPEPLYPVSHTSGHREALRIRTDMMGKGSPPGCSSAIHVSSTTWSPMSAKPMSAPPIGGLKQLHLSSIINKRSSTLSTHSSSIASSILSIDHIFNSSIPQSPSVSSTTSFSFSCEGVPEEAHHTLKRSSPNALVLQAANDVESASQPSSTRRDLRSISAPTQQPKSWRLSHYRAGSRNFTSADGTHRFPRRTSLLSLSNVVDDQQEVDEYDSTISRPIWSEYADSWTHPTAVLAAPVHAIATPKPTLLFAIASDNVDEVRQVLESGEAGPNDSVGPQSALAFTLTNDKLAHKQEIVKALLAYGANPSALGNPALNPAPRKGDDESSNPPPETTPEGMDPATRYFVARANAAHTRQISQLIYRSCFRPLTRVRYDVIGQDWALEQLFRILNIHSQKLAVAPVVVLLCGPSGHGKSLLARKFGSLLEVPTHTVNMTTLQSAHDIWQSYSMSPYEEPSSCTLAEFLTENEGKRCVVVLDEIEKVEDQKALWPLLMPWELGRCSLEAGKRHIDACNVIWLGTSNVGHELVFEHHANRAEPDKRMSREEYLELTGILRPRVSHCLGASLVSRVTAVLPFVPFTLDEQKAIAAEAVYALWGDDSKGSSPQNVESLVMKALPSYHPDEGARSLHRAVSNILIDVT